MSICGILALDLATRPASWETPLHEPTELQGFECAEDDGLKQKTFSLPLTRQKGHADRDEAG